MLVSVLLKYFSQSEEHMLIASKKKKSKSTLTHGQQKLLKESLKQLLGNGLLQSQSRKTIAPTTAFFLKDALNSRFLNN
jgi:hypothetical protein